MSAVVKDTVNSGLTVCTTNLNLQGFGISKPKEMDRIYNSGISINAKCIKSNFVDIDTIFLRVSCQSFDSYLFDIVMHLVSCSFLFSISVRIK